MRFGKDDDKGNWIDLDREMIILNDYKTHGKYGKIEYKLKTKTIVK